MATARRSAEAESATRTALLDAAETLMVEDGYAAVTTRSVANKAGVNNGLVSYYFGTMDGLYIELFRRGAERSLARLKQVLQSDQPLWSLWSLTHDYSSNALTAEFTALSNHRKAIRNEIANYSRTFRTLQLEGLTGVLTSYGVDAERWPPASIILAMTGISRYLHIEESFDVTIGHDQMVSVIEREIRALEGERGSVAAKKRAPKGAPPRKPRSTGQRMGSSPKTVVRKSSRGESGS
jgi:AcrR family transcriptional regulator